MSQLALFQDDAFAAPKGLPNGLRYAREFVTDEVERELVARVAELPLKPFQFGAFEGHRRVKSFGFRYDYTLQKLRESDPIPDWLRTIARAIEAFGDLSKGSVRQVLCTEYEEGVGIGWHRDKAYFGKVFGLSLLSPCKFRFRRRHADKWERFALGAEPRSLYLMEGEARHDWEHSIGAVEERRYSITFRTMADATSGETAAGAP
jgi:alkylated DNA repair dioxygenase AlkB